MRRLNLYICYLTSILRIRSVASPYENKFAFLAYLLNLDFYLSLASSPATNPLCDGFDHSLCIRSSLFLLPFFIRGIYRKTFYVPPGLRADLIALSRATSFLPYIKDDPQTGGFYIHLHMPTSPSTARRTRQRLSLSAMVENSSEMECVYLRGHRYVACFAYSLARHCEQSTLAGWEINDSIVGIHSLADMLLELVSDHQAFLDSSSRRLTIRINNVYGSRNSLHFWRIAGLPLEHYWLFGDQGGVELLHQSKIQQLLREGEGS
ncbi:P0 protein [Cotton bunchy top virus 2]|nr:P0 protein [Cotton bunchy top virus 2]